MVVLIALLAGSPVLAAKKTDVLVMHNGDTITCEIKDLSHNMLTVKTDNMGTLDVEWDKIGRLSSVHYFLVRTTGGFLHYGRLPGSDEDGVLVVEGPTRTVRLEMKDIANLETIKATFWDKHEISIAAGYSYTKSTSVQGLLFDSSFDYRGRVHRYGLSLLLDISDNSVEVKHRYDGNVYYARVISGKWFGVGSIGASRHDELGLDLRLRVGGGAGYFLVDTRHSALQTMAGVYGTKEWAQDSDAVEKATEGMLAADFSIFIYDSPKTDIGVKLAAMPSFTVSDRIRWEMDISASRELLKDFYIVLSYFESGDSKPVNGQDSTTDRSVNLQFKWTKK